MKRILIVLALVAVFAALYVWRYEAGWKFSFLLNPGGAFDEAEAGPAPDYAAPDAWLAQTDDDPARGAVFYIHPTTLLKTKTWNQPIAAAKEDAFLDFLGPQQISVFKDLLVHAPYYRQAAFYAFIAHEENSDKALALASEDVVRAFESFIDRYPEGPIIIAGHSQGAYHALGLLRAIDGNEALMSRIAAVYAIGYPFPENYLETTSPLPECSQARPVHCVLTYNARGSGAYIPAFFEKTPLPGGAPREGGRLACWNPSSKEGIVGAVCDDDGWLLIARPPERFREFLMSREWYHSVELDLFANEIRNDAKLRLQLAQDQ
ncbi:MAG: hypothetical protein CMI63_02985 [Parvularcula sp.]|nr:hypothetical protein [Parvularcula sp.]